MGSCVSHCSRQDVVHQQTGRVISSVHKSIEVTSDSDSLQKSLGIGSGIQVSESKEVRDQINSEIRALREQLVRSQVLFTYLLKSSATDSAKSPDGKKELCTLLEGGTLGDSMFQCKSFDGQVLARFYNRSNRSSSSYASHRSTPLHCGYTSLSCPTLPIDFPVVTKSTQTEPQSGAICIDQSSSRRALSSESTHSLNKASSFFSPPSTPCETIPETFLLSDVCEVHREPEEHLYPRHRTNSFLSAVKEGNPKLVDAVFGNNDKDMKHQRDLLESVQRNNEISHFISDIQNSCSHASSTSKMCEMEGRNADETKECGYPRKLSILLEEDYEDGAGNLFSVCNSQQYFNRKKKMLPSCNAKTQTDLTLPNNSALCRKQKFSPKHSKMNITETCFPRYGCTIVSQAVQKKTIHSVELPQKLILRYPPPYTKKISRRRYYTCSGDSYFQEHQLKHKNNVCSWSASEYFPTKSESSHNLTPNSQDCKLQTRHLSLEKQESFSSCDHSLYPDSRMSSVTDCSGWITKSDIELNLRPELPSYQQSLLSSQRSQSSKNSKLEGIAAETNNSFEKSNSELSRLYMLERTKSDSDAKSIDDKNGSTKEKNVKQRSMRRGSGAGSPNSQLCIPRYPAFDFSEQEDVHAMFPSPSESEANREIKETIEKLQKAEKAKDTNSSPNAYRLTNNSQKRRDASKSKTLMPEFMENSETESTKGSFECETSDLLPPTEVTSIPVPDIAFPSLPNTFLAKLGVHKDSPLPVDAFDEQDLESKFIALSLAFKTDRSTVCKRLELHKRQRDMAEKNVENEFQSMREHLSALHLKATSSDVRDLITKIQNHLDIAQQAASRVSGRSETYGAVQQEERVSRAFEVLVLHVDHLKRLFDKEHKELEETKRMLTDTRVFKKDPTSDVLSEDQKKYSKTFGLPVGSIKSVGRRRASVADFQSRSFLENCRSPGFSQSWTSGLSVRKVETNSSPLNRDPLDNIVGLNSDSLSTSPVISKSPTVSSTSGIRTRRSSLPDANSVAPSDTQSPKVATEEPSPPISLFPQKSFNRKKEINIWTRKLSSVTDEKEQSEDESEQPKFDENKIENPSVIKQEQFMLRDFLQQVEQKNNLLRETRDNRFDVFDNMSDLPDETDSVDEICDLILNSNILFHIQNSVIGRSLFIPAVKEIWQQNSPYTLFRYFCSIILTFIALCFFFSLILPLIGMNMNLDFLKDLFASLFSLVCFR